VFSAGSASARRVLSTLTTIEFSRARTSPVTSNANGVKPPS
jgi:hypothetical protein